MTNYDFDVFLSYSGADRELARQFVQWMRRCGLRVWIDEEQLIPGSRFRVGLQQGLQESCHMVALLTETYHSRPWTQRELDVFDLDADRSERRLLGIELGAGAQGPLDQVFQVHQRIKWSSPEFDAEAFWKLHCGLTNTRPGPRENWVQNGNQLLESTGHCDADDNVNKRRFEDAVSRHSTVTDLDALVQQILHDNNRWGDRFSELRELIQRIPFERVVQDLIVAPWAVGFAEFAAIVALASLPQKHVSFSPWSFLDLCCQDIVTWFLMGDVLESSRSSEIWFSWAVSQETWDALPLAAARAPGIMAEHFGTLAKPAVTANVSFEAFEPEYDYGIMITPWNHFHLAWLATRLGDTNAGRAHASKLCSTTTLGDVRTGRFLNRLSTWSIFFQFREEPQIRAELCAAREALGMITLDAIPAIKQRLMNVWQLVRK